MKKSEIRDLCIERTWRRALKYLGEGRIKRMEEDENRIHAEVQGSNLYHIRIEDDKYECDCPYSGQGKCKHLIAVLMRRHLEFGEEMCLTCVSYENGKCMRMRSDGELIRERDRILYPTDHCMWFE